MKRYSKFLPLGAAAILGVQSLVLPAAVLADEGQVAGALTETQQQKASGDQETGAQAPNGETDAGGNSGTDDSGSVGGNQESTEGGSTTESQENEQPPAVTVDSDAKEGDDGWNVTLFNTIQAAVTKVAEGGTVTVEAGTYSEQVEINKDLTLVGDGAGKTIIAAPKTLKAWENAPAEEVMYAIVYVHDADVEIKDITVDGQGQGTEGIGLTGIAFYEAGGAVRNSVVANLRATSGFARQDGDGVYASSTKEKQLELTGNTIKDYQKNGIEISGKITAAVKANVVKTDPTGEVAQNGIQFLSEATGEVTGNTVSGNQYEGEDWAATGIMLYGSGAGLQVLNNTVEKADYAIDVEYCDGAAVSDNRVSTSDVGVHLLSAGSKTVVNNNDLSGNEVGIWNETETVTINGENNWWGDNDGPTTDQVTAGVKVQGSVDFDPWRTSAPTFYKLEIDGSDEITEETSWTYKAELENRTAAAPVNVIFAISIGKSGIDDNDVTVKYSLSSDSWTKVAMNDEGSHITATVGSEGGYTVQPDNSKTLKLRLNFDHTGRYTLKVQALRAENPAMVIAEDSMKIDVEREKSDKSSGGSSSGSSSSRNKETSEQTAAQDQPTSPTSPTTPTTPSASTSTSKDTPSGTISSEPNENGTAALVAHVTSEAAASTSGTLSIDLTAATTSVNVANVIQNVPVETRTADLPTDVLDALVIQGRNVVINTPEASLEVPPAALPRSHAGSVRISVRSIDPGQVLSGEDAVVSTSLSRAQSQGLTPASPVLAFKAEAASAGSSSAITSFNQPITVRIPFTTFTNLKHLGVYRLDRTTGEWKYKGGKVDAANQEMVVELNGFSEYAVMEYTKSFVDVPIGHWAKDDIELMAARHIAQGVNDYFFMPEKQITRAEFAALLVRTLGLEPASVLFRNFSDVHVGDWFYGEVAAASNLGLVTGSDGTFRPNDPVTRQEMAAMLTRVLTRENMALPLSDQVAAGYVAAYQDGSQVASWAVTSVAQATRMGLMRGRTPVTFEPNATATRAEAVVVLERLLEAIGQA